MTLWGWKKYKVANSDNSSDTTGLPVEPSDLDDNCSSDEDVVESPATTTRHPQTTTRCLHHGQWKKILADVALAMGSRDFAFGQYADICDDIFREQSLRSTSIDLHVASCLGTASNPEQVRRALTLLDHARVDDSRPPELDLQIFLLSTLLESPGYTSPDSKSRSALPSSVKARLDRTIWPKLARTFSVADLGTWLALMRVMPSAKLDKNSTRYDKEFLRKQPVWSWAKARQYKDKDPNKPSALLKCFEWTTLQLKNMQPKVSPMVRDFNIDDTEQHWLRYFVLFTSLLELARHDPDRTKKNTWWSSSEPELSMSPVLLLSTVCRLILDEFDKELDKEQKPCPHTDLATLQPDLSHYLEPAGVLGNCAKEYLWKAFLGKLHEQDGAAPLPKKIQGYVVQYLESLDPSDDHETAHDDGAQGDFDVVQQVNSHKEAHDFANDLAYDASHPLTRSFNYIPNYGPSPHGYDDNQEDGGFGTGLAEGNVFAQFPLT